MYRLIRKYMSNVHIYKFDPASQRLDVDFGKRGKLEKLSRIGSPKPGEKIACKTNAGFFALDGSAEHIGTLVDEGLYYNPPVKGFIDLIFTKDYKLLGKNLKDLDEVAYWQENSFWVIGTSFTLVLNGKVDIRNTENTSHHKHRNPRTAIGQTENGDIMHVVVEGRNILSLGVTAKQLAKIMLGEGCVTAVNLDGGGSSEMIIDDKIVAQSSDGSERPIGTALVVYKKEARSNMKKIFIDPGHGGSDPGAVANEMQEKDINLVVALKLKELLEHKGFDLMLSRETDKYVGLSQRAYMANEWDADYFISIHHNAGGGDGWEIIHTIHTDISEGDELAHSIGREFTGLGQDMRRIFARESTKYPGTDYYTVIGQSNMPAVITEFAFMDSDDSKAIDTKEELHSEAQAICDGICKYLGINKTHAWEQKYYRMAKQFNGLKQDIKNVLNKY